MANAVITTCIPNLLLLQTTQTGSAPASAGERSGVSPCSCKEGVGCGSIPYILPTQQVTFPAIL